MERLREGDPDLVGVRTEEDEPRREGEAVGLLVPRANARGLKRLEIQNKKREGANITEKMEGRGGGGGGYNLSTVGIMKKGEMV